MPDTDRAFRALARAGPSRVRALVRAALGVAFPAVEVTILHDPKLDLPPFPKEADLVLEAGADIDHFECQGYRQGTFLDRLFHYHLVLVLRHPGRRVRSWAVWTVVPPDEQRASIIARGDVVVHVTHIVLPEIPATRLLADPALACFAAGAAPDGVTVDELCDRVAQSMAHSHASFEEMYFAAMVAVAQKRYDALIAAMERANMQPIIIEDLVDYGFDQGLEKGIEKGIERGIEKGRAAALLDVLEARGFVLDDAARARVTDEHDVERLRHWCRRAVTAGTLDDVFAWAPRGPGVD